MSDVTEQIKERLNVADLLGEYLKLEKAGTNYKALCPFHNEKTPSFMVNPERNFWYCFGCQKGGDIFSFVMEMEGMEFREVLERLGERAGVEIPRFQKIDKKSKDRKQRLYEIVATANNFYKNQIHQTGKSHQIRQYLIERKIDLQQINEFEIGYAPEGWSNLLQYLIDRGYNLADIAATGLLVQKENSSGGQKWDYYDRFRNRITFPVFDQAARVVGYSARVAPGGDESSAKYINTPQTEIYDKSRLLYGINLAKAAIKREGYAIIVEGNLDVIASFSAGVENAIAVSGTALTTEQVDILKRLVSRVKLCFDMDEAGQKAAKKSVQTCLEKEMEAEIILLPKGFKDVNDLVIEDPLQWKKAVGNSLPVMEYFFQRALSGRDKKNPQGKRAIAHELLNIIKHISEPIEQSYWIKKISEEIEVEEDTLTQVLEKVSVKDVEASKRGQETKKEQPIQTKKPRILQLQENLLGLFSLYQAELKEKYQNLENDWLDESYLQKFKLVSEGKAVNNKEIAEIETRIRYNYDSRQGFVENDLDPLIEWDSLCKELQKEYKRKKLNEIIWDIKKAEKEGDEEALKILMQEFSKISKK